MVLFDADADSDDDDDAGFIEVADKEGFEPTIPEHQREEYGLTTTLSTTTTAAAAATMSWQQKEHQLDVEDPTSLAASVIKRQQLALEQQKARDMLADCLLLWSQFFAVDDKILTQNAQNLSHWAQYFIS